MKFCWKVTKTLPYLKIICFHISSALIIWSCCCYRGNESRPVSVSHVSPITCHVIFEKSHRRPITQDCSCKCCVWCRNSPSCLKWNLKAQTQFLQPQSSKTHPHTHKILATACKGCCDKNFTSSIFYESPQVDFRCKTSELNHNSSYCDNHLSHNWCCSVYCFNEQNIGPCTYLYPYSPVEELNTLSEHTNNILKYIHFSPNAKKREFLRRKKRNSKYQLPYHIQVLDSLNEFTVHQPFNIRIQLIDEQGAVVPDTGRNVELKIVAHQASKTKVEFNTTFHNGRANFSNISFNKIGKNYRLSLASKNSPEILPWLSEKLTVNYRPLSLQSSGRNLPISTKENDTLSPAAGVIIYDDISNKPATKSYLSQFTLEASISLLYEDVYPGQLLGTTTKVVTDGSNEIIFDDVLISAWGYSYILKIEVKSESHRNLTYFIGPFDVDRFDTFDQPLVESDEFRRVKIVFDNRYEIVEKDERKFEIFFLNHFGIEYSNVRWRNVTLSKGSIIVDSIITGLTEYLEKTSEALEEAIETDKADVVYEENMLKPNKIFLPSRKLLEESISESSVDGGGGLSVAWIVAIVVNVILIVVFILAIVYCYCRRKKQRELPGSASTINHFDGGPKPLLYGNKSENQMSLQDKAAIFTIEDSHAKLGNHRTDSGAIHRDGSPSCYCSTGDGRKTDTTLQFEDENVDDPQGYPSPTPEPRFPTPEPSPEPSPEPEEFWRQEDEPEEEEEEMFLPGAVSEPSPEPSQEERFYVYLLTDIDGSRELVGQIYLKVDSFLSETRHEIDRDRDLSELIEGREYRFLDENLDTIPNYQESSMDLERVFPSQGINIQYLPQKAPTPKPAPRPKRILPAYVGPLGICNAPDCTKAAKIKCLDCRNIAYCSKRCMRDDANDHRKACFKPAWRL